MKPFAAPFHFGPKERPLFGWYHAPSSPHRSIGVVVCAPLGHEMTYLYRTMRHAAERLAAAGFPVVRFDYDGTGDSAGSDEDPDRVSAWLSSIRLALDELRARGGVRRLALFGARLGATLATLVASERDDVEDLVLFAAPTSGKTYARELRALGALGTAASAREARGESAIDFDGQEAAGFVLTTSTLKSLRGIDLLALQKPPAPHVLLLPRDDVADDDELRQRLRALGVDVERRALAGYRLAMDEPLRSVVPDALLDSAVEWLVSKDDVPPKPTAAPTTSDVPPASTAVIGDVRETATYFGTRDVTFAVLTEPLARSAQSDTAIVMLNTATDSRIGPNRMHVDLARAWAARGFTVCRMDLSGIGDTPARPGSRENAAFSGQFVNDAKLAIDFLAARGARKFVLMGLCSGAYRAYHTAVADPRVTGAILINPQSFYYREGDEFVRIRAVRYYRHALFRSETWKRLLSDDIQFRTVAPLLARKLRTSALNAVDAVWAKVRGRRDPSLDVAQFLVEMTSRGVELYFVFSAGDPGVDYLVGHMGRKEGVLRARKNFRVDVIDGADHTFTRHWARRELFDKLTSHVVQRFA